MYQLAEFLSVPELLGFWRPPGDITTDVRATLNSGSPTLSKTNHNVIPIYAQEPLFNKLDKQHLASLGITVIENPGIWELIGSESLVYSPGAEKRHWITVAKKKPGIWGPLHVVYIKYAQGL